MDTGSTRSRRLWGKKHSRRPPIPTRFPEQLKWAQPWQAEASVVEYVRFHAGAAEGSREVCRGAWRSIPEISIRCWESLTRRLRESAAANIKTQAMGAPQRSGSAPDYFVTSRRGQGHEGYFRRHRYHWNRVPGGADIGRQLSEAAAQYEMEHPEETVARSVGGASGDRRSWRRAGNIWGVRKLRELDEAAALCAGLWVDAEASQAVQTPGGSGKST